MHGRLVISGNATHTFTTNLLTAPKYSGPRRNSLPTYPVP